MKDRSLGESMEQERALTAHDLRLVRSWLSIGNPVLYKVTLSGDAITLLP